MHEILVNSKMKRRAIAFKIASKSFSHLPWEHKHIKNEILKGNKTCKRWLSKDILNN